MKTLTMDEAQAMLDTGEYDLCYLGYRIKLSQGQEKPSKGDIVVGNYENGAKTSFLVEDGKMPDSIVAEWNDKIQLVMENYRNGERAEIDGFLGMIAESIASNIEVEEVMPASDATKDYFNLRKGE